jgi:hypothetical protein
MAIMITSTITSKISNMVIRLKDRIHEGAERRRAGEGEQNAKQQQADYYWQQQPLFPFP